MIKGPIQSLILSISPSYEDDVLSWLYLASRAIGAGLCVPSSTCLDWPRFKVGLHKIEQPALANAQSQRVAEKLGFTLEIGRDRKKMPKESLWWFRDTACRVSGDWCMFSIIGAPASGKMTIGQNFQETHRCDSLFNHQPIDFALEILSVWRNVGICS